MSLNILNLYWLSALVDLELLLKYNRWNLIWKSKEYIQIFVDVLFHHKPQQKWNWTTNCVSTVQKLI